MFQNKLEYDALQISGEYRLSKAAELLAKINEPVVNIVAAVGFHQMSHFGKCFKEKTGYSPKAYREMENSR